MTVLEAVKARLVQQSAVMTLVETSTRITAQLVSQTGKLPAIRLQRIGEQEPTHLRGTSGLHRVRVQVDSIATTRAEAVALDEAVHGDGATTGLCGFSGVAGGLAISAILPADVRDGFDPDELKQYRVSRDYMVIWNQ